MSLEGQRLQPERYALIPRTLTFLIHDHHILLIKVPDDRGAWAGLYNGVGGHIERGEDPLTAALREVQEETQLSPLNLQLCGIVQVDTNTNPGIVLFVFQGEVEEKTDLIAGPEGKPEWISLVDLDELPLVEDLPDLIPRVLSSMVIDQPFFASYHYNAEGQLSIGFSSDQE